MRIVIEHIKAENFLSYENFELDFKDLGFVHIKGVNKKTSDNSKSNGAGKSAIFEAICYTLTGETMRGITDVVRDSSDGCLVELSAKFDDKDFIIKRSLRHKEFGTNLKIYVNGEDKSGKGIRDSKKILSELLPDLTPKLVGSIIVLGQGLPYKFTDNTPSGRKEVLESLTKSDFMIEDIKNRVDKRQSTLQEHLLSADTKVHELNAENNALNNELSNLSKMIEDIEDVDELKKQLSTVESDLLGISERLERQLEFEESQKKVYEEQAESLRELLSDFNTKVAETKQKFSNDISDTKVQRAKVYSALQLKKQELIKLSSVKDTCPTCGQKLIGVKLPSLDPVKNEISSLEEELSDLDSLLENYQEEFDRELKALEKKYEEEKTSAEISKSDSELLYCDSSSIRWEIESELQTKREEKISIEERIKKSKFLLDRGESRKTEISDRRKEILLQTEKLEADRAENESRFAAISKIKSLVNRDFRGYLLRNVVSYISEILHKYSRIVYNGEQSVDVALNGNNIDVTVGKLLYEQLSGGERQKADIIVQLAIRQMLSNLFGYSCNICCMDEIFDNLDSVGCDKILELISEELKDVEDVFIITHHEDLQLPCDRLIMVYKDEEGVSRIL